MLCASTLFARDGWRVWKAFFSPFYGWRKKIMGVGMKQVLLPIPLL